MTGLRLVALALVSTLFACSKEAPETPAPPVAPVQPPAAAAPATPATPAAPAAPEVPAAAEAAAPAADAEPPTELEEKLADAQEFIDKVDQGLKRAKSLKEALEAAIEQNRGIPPSLDSVRARALPPAGADAASIEVANNGSIIVEYPAERGFPGGTVEVKPVVSNGTVTSWTCSGGTLPAEFRPPSGDCGG
jgi:hypothetical protein